MLKTWHFWIRLFEPVDLIYYMKNLIFSLKITFLAITATRGGILLKILAFLDSPFRAGRFDILYEKLIFLLKIMFLAITATRGGILMKILAFLDSPFRAGRFDILYEKLNFFA